MLLAIAIVSAGLSAAPAEATSLPKPHVSLSVAGKVELLDAPLGLRVEGLAPHEAVLVRAGARDASGVRWASRADFVASTDGVVDPSRQSPRSGSYRGVHAQGLLWSMRPVSGERGTDSWFVLPQRFSLTLSVSASGHVLIRRTVVRVLERSDVRRETLTPGAQGLYGRYAAPIGLRNHDRPAVLLIGGSQGGIGTPVEADLLASHGYPTLALAYFDEPGLPQTLEDIPLEYFARALRWLGRQPGVDPRRLIVYGASRGAEAALLVAAHFPALVNGVIALAPSNVAMGSYPGCAESWTLDGRPLPYQCNQGPTASPAAATIPVGRIPVPLLLACGGADSVWPSCPMAHAIERRRPHSSGDLLIAFPKAGHGIDGPAPNFPLWAENLAGATPQANPVAREQLWPRLLRFIERSA